MNKHIRSLTSSDQTRVLEIYAMGLASKNATFETQLPNWATWDRKHLDSCRFACCFDDTLVGWSALTNVSPRECYSGVAEVSVYIDVVHHRQGIGSALLKILVDESEANNIWTLQSSVFPENRATVALHKKYGFRELGIRQRIAKLDGQWRDTLIMERRSQIVGL
ncbi:MAG: L-amino acid N-acyltransferase YncA [Gammaproteobacteria bacterium]|jgi:L-amino acid N-acyltransferase YncA